MKTTFSFMGRMKMSTVSQSMWILLCVRMENAIFIKVASVNWRNWTYDNNHSVQSTAHIEKIDTDMIRHWCFYDNISVQKWIYIYRIFTIDLSILQYFIENVNIEKWTTTNNTKKISTNIERFQIRIRNIVDKTHTKRTPSSEIGDDKFIIIRNYATSNRKRIALDITIEPRKHILKKKLT